jgi:hypothetical protein
MLLAGSAVTIGGVIALPVSLASPSSASTTGCAFTNGCATLNGVDAASHAIAMDATKQSAKTGTLIIGYPDRPNDGATNFDAVLHFTTSSSPTYSDTSLLVQQPTNNAFVHRYDLGCVNGADADTHNPLTTDAASSFEGHAVTWSLTDTTDPDVAIDSVTGQVTDPGTAGDGIPSTADVTVTDGADVANAVVTVNDAGAPTLTVDSGNCITIDSVPAEQGGGVQFDAVDHSFTGGDTGSSNNPEPYTWSATGLPGGVSINPATGFIAPGTAAPGSYGVTVKATDESGAVSIITFTLQVNASTGSVAVNTPYYTFVYAKNGVWTSQCVTDVSGSGALQLIPCTLGHNRYQDFFALNGAGDPVGTLTSGGQFHIQDFLASIVSGASSCLTDPSSLVPGIPQSNATDEAGAPIPGRQMRADGSCSATQNLFTWAS